MKRFAAAITLSALGLSVGFAQFTLFAAETIAGSLGSNSSLYGGLQQYDFATTGGSFTPGPGLSPSQLSDPVGLRRVGSNVLVANRHGNTIGLGSVQSFAWNGTGLIGGATIATQSAPAYQGFAGIDVSVVDQDLYVATVNSGMRRYHDPGTGYADIDGTATGTVRDVLLAPNGQKAFQTNIAGQIYVTDITGPTLGSTTAFNVAGANAMHQMAWRNGAIYATSFHSGTVHRIDLDGSFNPVSSSTILSVPGAIGIAFSPDGQEMFVSSHTGDFIARFLDSGGTWVSNGAFATGHNMGYLATVPEPSSAWVIGLGLLAWRRRRRAC